MFVATEQPYIGLVFISAGMAGYLAYEIFYTLKILFGGKAAEFIADLLSLVSASLIYVLVAEKLHYGQIKAYTLFCFVAGWSVMRLVLKNTLRRIFSLAAIKLRERRRQFFEKAHNFFLVSQANRKRRKYERQI